MIIQITNETGTYEAVVKDRPGTGKGLGMSPEVSVVNLFDQMSRHDFDNISRRITGVELTFKFPRLSAMTESEMHEFNRFQGRYLAASLLLLGAALNTMPRNEPCRCLNASMLSIEN